MVGHTRYRSDPRTVRVHIFIMAVDPNHMYLNKTERAMMILKSLYESISAL